MVGQVVYSKYCYYKNYLTKHKILTNYNLLKNKNPPIISDLLKY